MSFAIVTAKLPELNAWGKPAFYYKHGLSGLVVTAGGTSAGNIDNVLNRLEVDSWTSVFTGGLIIINYDAGPGNEYTADYFGINGHTLTKLGNRRDAYLQHSNDDFSADINTAVILEPETSDPIIGEFESATDRYWRVLITGGGYQLRIANMIWGQKTELDWATSDFDPNESEYDDIVNISQTGVLLGIHKKQRKRFFKFSIKNAESELYQKANTWFETVGLEPFFVCWNYDDNPEDCFYMRNNPGSFLAPYGNGKDNTYRKLNFDLIGRSGPWQ